MVRYFGHSNGKVTMAPKEKYYQLPRLSEWFLKCLFPDKNFISWQAIYQKLSKFVQ